MKQIIWTLLFSNLASLRPSGINYQLKTYNLVGHGIFLIKKIHFSYKKHNI